ncbi:MAG: YicC family protein [Kiritimatiellae bacterium]|jgi:uncharacterized protein (TIGR00255 family)|nr:YicC family protein [Kiritimatiellia bacterium]
MPIKSMTGFGQATSETEDYNISVEISSVNKKQLDIRTGMAKEYISLENKVIELVKTQVTRGTVALLINISPVNDHKNTNVQVDKKMAKDIFNKFEEVSKELNIKNDIGTACLISVPGIVTATSSDDISFDDLWEALKETIIKAFEKLIIMRTQEGQNLSTKLNDLLSQTQNIKSHLDALAPKAVEEYKTKFLERLDKIRENVQIDDERIQQEIALFADKIDIEEELTRLDSHFNQMKQYLDSNQPVGRPMDFLCQEILREINTIGSKANNLEITKQVLEGKALLESFREQIQNVE